MRQYVIGLTLIILCNVRAMELSKQLSKNDLKCLTEKHQKLLKGILEKSNQVNKNSEDNGIANNRLFKIKNEHIELLQSIDNIRALDCFKDPNSPFNQALIYVKCKPSYSRRMSDRLLFVSPIVMATAMPDLIHNQTNGFLQGLGGFCTAGLGGFMLGHPIIDSCNYGRAKLAKYFGSLNQADVDRRWLCLVMTMTHYLSTIIAQKFFEWGTLPYQILGGVIYAGKALFSLHIVWLQEDYSDPCKRSNAKGCHYTLGDLIAGPKFHSNK